MTHAEAKKACHDFMLSRHGQPCACGGVFNALGFSAAIELADMRIGFKCGAYCMSCGAGETKTFICQGTVDRATAKVISSADEPKEFAA